jgi:hypothetical protein
MEMPPRLVIFSGCCMVSVPMIGFSILILAFVFADQMEKATCPYPELCPLLNATQSSYYYVNMPATRLVFVASWSSSISLVLVNMLMMMLSYWVSKQITTTTRHSRLPTPYQAMILMKTLNGELWALVDFFIYKCKNFSFRGKRDSSLKIVTPPVLSKAIGIFFTGICLRCVFHYAAL